MPNWNDWINRKLDADLAKFESEMKETGGRLSQTESEDEENAGQLQDNPDGLMMLFQLIMPAWF